MSEIAIGGRPGAESAFRPAIMGLIVAIGILAFIAMLVLGAYAPDLRSGHNGGAHALSNSATGYSGLVRLAEATGRNPIIVRNAPMLDTDDLVVLTPESGTTDMSKALEARGDKPTLIVLPKWATIPDKSHSGWVRAVGVVPTFDPEGVLAPQYKLKVGREYSRGAPLKTVPALGPPEMRFTAPGALQTASGPGFKPIIADQAGHGVLLQYGDKRFYVLADPDLISNRGISDEHQAAAALAMLDYLNSAGKTVSFDVTLNGLGHSPSPLRLAFDPPFLATTLAIAAALLLAALQALTRFGAARRPERALAFGKAALLDNSAALVRQAGREASLGARYAEMIRERAIAIFGVPQRLQGKAVDDYLDALAGDEPFSKLAEAAGGARHRDDLLAAARALHSWQKENEG
ncbi:MAG TPA: DUF4350 domain-containing protein [Allosphingosinicella sp.]|nr:DUF4350 domain-containing protein [Allosphingosinicella sp.]